MIEHCLAGLFHENQKIYKVVSVNSDINLLSLFACDELICVAFFVEQKREV